jgi:hypothetical protein
MKHIRLVFIHGMRYFIVCGDPLEYQVH